MRYTHRAEEGAEGCFFPSANEGRNEIRAQRQQSTRVDDRDIGRRKGYLFQRSKLDSAG